MNRQNPYDYSTPNDDDLHRKVDHMYDLIFNRGLKFRAKLCHIVRN